MSPLIKLVLVTLVTGASSAITAAQAGGVTDPFALALCALGGAAQALGAFLLKSPLDK